MDNFKKYVQEHTDAMDFDAPSASVWNDIEREISTKKSVKLYPVILKFAAAAAIITAIVVATIQFTGNKTNDTIAINKHTPVVQPTTIIADSGQPIVSTNVYPASQDTMAPPLKAKLPAKKTDERYAMMQAFKENYGQLASYQLSSIRSTAVYAEDPAYFDDFKIRLRQMDADELAIRNRIRRQGMSNNLLEQLINVYQQKLDVLKSLQAEINKMNERVKENEPTDSLNKYYLNI